MEDDIFAALLALNAINRLALSGTEGVFLPVAVLHSVLDAIRYARFFLLGRATPDEPCALGFWLASWFAVLANADYPAVDRALHSVERALHRLRVQQGADGRWFATPIRRAAEAIWARPDFGRLYADPDCIVRRLW